MQNWPNNVLLGKNLDEEQFQVDTHAVLSFIMAPIAVRHGDQRMSIFLATLRQVPQLGGRSKWSQGECELAQQVFAMKVESDARDRW